MLLYESSSGNPALQTIEYLLRKAYALTRGRKENHGSNIVGDEFVLKLRTQNGDRGEYLLVSHDQLVKY